MKKNKAGNLPPVRVEIPGNDSHQFSVFKFFEDSECRCLRTPWLLTKSGYLRVTTSIIGPKTSRPKGKFPLRGCQAEDSLQALADTVVALKKEVLREDTPI